MERVTETKIFNHCKIIFRNFKGDEVKNSKGQIISEKGKRQFSIFIDDTGIAGQLADEGWNIKPLKPKDDDPDARPAWHLPVAVSYDSIPPKIYKYINGTKELVDEATVGNLDYDDFLDASVVVRPYNWEVRGLKGVKAYVKTMHIVVDGDELANEYARYINDHTEEEEIF